MDEQEIVSEVTMDVVREEVTFSTDFEVEHIVVGEEFSTYSELRERLKQFQMGHCVQLYIRRSRTIQATKRRLPQKFLNPALRFYEIEYSCIHGGKKFKSRSQGQRPNRLTFQIQCPFAIIVRARPDGEMLVVKTVHPMHNHEVNQRITPAVNDTGVFQWTKQAETHLNDFYQYYPCLWDTQNPDYRNVTMKTALLLQLQKQLQKYLCDVSVRDIRRRFNKIRPTLCRRLRKKFDTAPIPVSNITNIIESDWNSLRVGSTEDEETVINILSNLAREEVVVCEPDPILTAEEKSVVPKTERSQNTEEQFSNSVGVALSEMSEYNRDMCKIKIQELILHYKLNSNGP